MLSYPLNESGIDWSHKYSMRNFYVLKFDQNFILDNINISSQFTNCWETVKIPINKIASSEGINFINQLRITPSPLVNLFIGPPNSKTSIHHDSVHQSYAINHVWDDTRSIMRWYKQLSQGESNLTTANTPFTSFKEDQVELIEELEFPKNKLILVRIDIPHSVENYSNEKRLCLSIRGIPTLKWHDAVSFFKDYILE